MLNITTTRGLSRSAKDRRIDGLIPAPSSRPSLCLEKRRWIQSIMIIYLLVLLALFKFIFVLNFVSVKNKNKIKISVRSLKIPWRASPSGPASAHRENIPGKQLKFWKTDVYEARVNSAFIFERLSLACFAAEGCRGLSGGFSWSGGSLVCSTVLRRRDSFFCLFIKSSQLQK